MIQNTDKLNIQGHLESDNGEFYIIDYIQEGDGLITERVTPLASILENFQNRLISMDISASNDI